MKSKSSFRDQFGITQEEMAQLLGIAPSRWSMYEAGLRELPAQALELLAAFLKHTASKPATKTLRPDREKQLSLIDTLLSQNDYEQLKVKRAVAAFDKKSEALAKRLALKDFLQTRVADGKSVVGTILPDGKKYRGETDHAQQGLLLERRQALLDFEKQWLEQQRKAVG